MGGLFSALPPEGARLLREDADLVWNEYVFRHPFHLALALALLGLVFAVSSEAHQVEVDRLKDLANRHRRRLVLGAMAVAFTFSLALDLLVLGGLPHTQDEIAYLFQARTLATGRLSVPAPDAAVAGAVRIPFAPMREGRWFGKYWPGWPLALAPAARLGLEALVNPMLVAVAVWLFHGLLQRHYGNGWALAGAWAMALSPAVLVMGASMMSQPLALVLFLGLLEGLQRWRDGEGLQAAMLVGLGCAGLVLGRPVEAVVLGGPVLGAMALHAPARLLRAPVGLALLVPVLLAGALLLAYNQRLTGNPLAAPFLLEHPGDRPGFGPDRGVFSPEGHNAEKGLVHLGLNLVVLNEDLLGWPMFSLVLPCIGAMGSRDVVPIRRLMGLCAVLVTLLYFTFVSHGIAFGARYYFVLVPLLLWLTLDGIRVLRARLAPAKWPALLLGVGAMSIVGASTYWPGRIDRPRDYWNVPSFPMELVGDAVPVRAVVVVPSVRVAGFRDLFEGFSSLNAPWPPDGDRVFVRDGPWGPSGHLERWLPGRPLVRLNRDQVVSFLRKFQAQAHQDQTGLK